MTAARQRTKKPPVVMEVVATEPINDHFQRITLGGSGFADYQDVVATDKYIKFLLPTDPSLGLEPPFDMDELRKTLPKEQLPVRRTYTVREVDERAQTLTVDFVLHGDRGVAGPWAKAARVGDRVEFGGPGGKYLPESETDFHFFVGDEAAIPAIAAALEALPEDAVGVAHIEVADPESRWELQHPAGVQVNWHYRHGEVTESSDQLEAAVKNTPWPEGQVQVFCHGEREVMKRLRAYFMDERGITRDKLSLSAYWAYGRAEDQFQAEKATPIGQIYENTTVQY